MMATRFTDHLLTGDHASRPAFGDVPQGTLYACTDHTKVYQSDGSSAWSDWHDPASAASSLIAWDTHRQTSALNITTNETTWQNLGTGTDLVVPAESGDIIEVTVSARWDGSATYKSLDVCSLVGGSPVNYFGSGEVTSTSGQGVPAWSGTTGIIWWMGGSVFKTVVSGDISGGNVTLRFRTRASSLTDYQLAAAATDPCDFTARVWRLPA